MGDGENMSEAPLLCCECGNELDPDDCGSDARGETYCAACYRERSKRDTYFARAERAADVADFLWGM